MANLSAAVVDRTMAIAMSSGLHVPAVVKQECVVDCRPSAEKQRSLFVGVSNDQLQAHQSIQHRFKLLHSLLSLFYS